MSGLSKPLQKAAILKDPWLCSIFALSSYHSLESEDQRRSKRHSLWFRAAIEAFLGTIRTVFTNKAESLQ